jgi:hypothetical protein
MKDSESSEFGKEVTLMGEVIITGRKVGADKSFWAALAHNEGLFTKVVTFVASEMKPVFFHLAASLDHDMQNDGWKLVSDSTKEVIYGEFLFTPELVEVLKNGEDSITGEEIVKRATELGAYAGQRHAEAMVRTWSKIPEDWRKFVLIFTDTIWEDTDGRRHVVYLRWKCGWALEFGWLGKTGGQTCRLVRLKKV